jgi:hypothetical protein
MDTIRFTILAALTSLAVSVVPSFAAPNSSAKASYNGQWSVLIVTEKGTCDRAYRYPVKIENGSLGYAGSASFSVSGSVGDNGALVVTVSKGDKSAKGTGHISSTNGTGTWTAAGGECSGTWTAERRTS